MIATMEAVLSVPAIPEPAGFDCGEYSGYLKWLREFSRRGILRLSELYLLVVMLLVPLRGQLLSKGVMFLSYKIAYR
jgi:hypothetical protein